MQGVGVGLEERHRVEEGETVSVCVGQAVGVAVGQVERETVRVADGLRVPSLLELASRAGVEVMETLPEAVAAAGVPVAPPTPGLGVLPALMLLLVEGEADGVGDRDTVRETVGVLASFREAEMEGEALLLWVMEGEPVGVAALEALARELAEAVGVPLLHCVMVGV